MKNRLYTNSLIIGFLFTIIFLIPFCIYSQDKNVKLEVSINELDNSQNFKEENKLKKEELFFDKDVVYNFSGSIKSFSKESSKTEEALLIKKRLDESIVYFSIKATYDGETGDIKSKPVFFGDGIILRPKSDKSRYVNAGIITLNFSDYNKDDNKMHPVLGFKYTPDMSFINKLSTTNIKKFITIGIDTSCLDSFLIPKNITLQELELGESLYLFDSINYILKVY